jgi:tetratricopeptide (TPR) repeat protein
VVPYSDSTPQIKISDQLEASDFQFELEQLNFYRCRDTGMWLLKRQAFIDFLEVDDSASFHLCGNPGSGKTFLTSKTIEHIRAFVADRTNTVLGYFLCDGKTDASNKRTSHAILRALTSQMLDRMMQVDPAFVRTHLDAIGIVKQKAKCIPEGQLFKVILKCLQRFEVCYIMIDAIDECDDWKALLHIIARLLDENICKLKLFLSSQKGMGIPYLISRLRVSQIYRIDVTPQAIESDIARFAEWKIRTLDVRGLGSPVEARDILIGGCDGLFLLMKLRLDILTRDILPRGIDMRKALQDLPSDVLSLYERLMNRLDDQQQALAQILFVWVIHAQGHLTVHELAEAYRKELEGATSLEEATLTPVDIEYLGGGLIDIYGDRVRLAHTTVREFAALHNWGRFATFSMMSLETSIDERLASICIRYMADSTLVADVLSACKLPGCFATNWPLGSYAGRSWLMHLQRSSTRNIELNKLVLQFIQSNAGLAWWIYYTTQIEIHNWWSIPKVSSDITAWLQSDYVSQYHTLVASETILGLCQRHISLLKKQKPTVSLLQYIHAIIRLADERVKFGHNKEAENLLRSVIGKFQNVSSGPFELLKIQVMLDLSSVPACEGLFEEAMTLCQDVLLRCESIGEHGLRQRISASQRLGELHRNLGQLDKSESLLRQVSYMAEQHLDQNDPDRLAVTNALFLTCFELGKYKEATELCNVEQFQSVLGVDHPSALTGMENVADLYRAQGKYTEAKVLFRRVLDTRQAREGAGALATIRSELNIAHIICSQGETSEAVRLVEELIQKTASRLPQDHYCILSFQSSLANMKCIAGEMRKASELQQHVLDVHTQRLGENHIWTLHVKAELANIQLKQMDFKNASVLLNDVLNVFKNIHGSSIIDQCNTMARIGSLQRSQGKVEEAERLEEQVLELRKKTGDEEGPKVLTAIGNLAFTKQARGKLEKAERLQEQVLEL